MRLYTLDYLRGFAALGIMMYHYLAWAYGGFDASTTLGRIGVYGVSIFYVLSGLTLNVVYRDKMNNFAQVKDFFTKRIFRIYPLLWIATIAATMFVILGGAMPGRMKLLLNMTGLFGFVRPHDSIANGAWSIGNELVFYAIFPLLILAMKKKLLIIPVMISLILYLVFAFVLLDDSKILAHNWPVYTNPLNQLFLFVAGFAIGMFNYKNTKVALIILASSIVVFILMPSRGDLIKVATGLDRIIYTVLSITICYSFYMLNNKMPLLHKLLSKLGEASYSVYLLHPIVFSASGYVIKDPVAKWIVCVPVTIALAYFMYKKLEKPFIEIGKMVNKVSTERQAITI